MLRSSHRRLAIIVELAGIAVVSIGIGFELAFGGPVHLQVIAGGSLLFAVGTAYWAKFKS